VGNTVTLIIIIRRRRTQIETFTTLKLTRSRPLVLLVKVHWREGEVVGIEESSMLGSGLLGTEDTVFFH